MANFWSKITVPTQLNRWSTADLSCDHITTMDVFKIKPIYTRELMPYQTININMDSLVRLEPLAKPFFGRMDLITRFFFVPYRTIFKGWNALITGTPYFDKSSNTQKLLDSVPYFTNLSLRTLLQNNSSSVASSSDDFDFIQSTLNGSTGQVNDVRYKLTNRGRYILDLLRCLGYEVSFLKPIGPNSDGYENVENSKKLSALPFLAYVKIWKDWYYNTVYAVPAMVEQLLNNYDAGGEISTQLISQGLDFISMANYDQDIFTAAWDRPVAPGQNVLPEVTMVDPTVGSDYANKIQTRPSSSASMGTPVVSTSGNMDSNPRALTQYAIDALKSLTDFFTRRKLVGSKTLDRYLAEWGKRLPDSNLDMSIYIGSRVSRVDVSDVMSTADTAGASLADYAGKGISYNNGFEVNWNSDGEFGQIVGVSVLVPHIGYVQGIDPQIVKHLTPLDFFNGDFDGLGAAPIRVDELISDFIQTRSAITRSDDSIFGWADRYYEYSIPKDRLTGDFRVRTKSTGLECYHLFRYFDPNTVSNSLLVHSNQFVVGDQQYDRIFSDPSSDFDHFVGIFRFNIKSKLPKSQLWDSYHFKHEKDSPAKDTTITIGGTRIN